MPGPPDPAERRLLQPGVLLVFGLLLATLTLQPASATRLHVWPWRWVALVVWAAPVVLLARHLLRGEPVRWPSSWLLAGVLVLTGSVVASAALSPHAALSLPHVWPTLGGAALLLLLITQWADHPARRPRFARILAAGAALLSVTTLAGGDLRALVSEAHRNGFPFGHSTLVAGALVLGLPWLGWAAGTSRGLRRVAWLMGLLLALLAIGATGSRAGALATAAMGALALVHLLRRFTLSRRHWIVLGAASVLLLGLGVASNPRLRPLALGRGWSELAQASNRQREAMLTAAGQIGRARPLLGWGPGTVSLRYPHVRADLVGGPDNVLQLHSTPAQLWATTGALGLAGAALIAFGLAGALVRRLRGADGIAATAACGLGGYVIVTLTDHQWDVPWIAAYGIAAVALLAQPRSPTRSHRGWGLIPLGLLAAATLVSLPDLIARRHFARGEIEAAAAANPADPYYAHVAASRAMVAGEATPAALITMLERSLLTRAHDEYAHLNLGWLQLDANPGAAAAHFLTAAHFAPTRGGVYFGLALAYHRQGLAEAARRCFALEALNEPLFIVAPFWELPGWSEERTAVLRELSELANAQPELRQRIAWIRWWAGETLGDGLPAGFSAVSRRFVASAPRRAADDPGAAAEDDRWSRVFAAWRTPEDESAWHELTPDAAFARALHQRALQHPDDFWEFLRAPAGDDPALLHTYRRVRTGYGVLAYHPAGAPPLDFQIVQEHRLVAELVRELMPAKGDLPGSRLLALLPPSS